MSVKIKIKPVRENFVMPAKSFEHDAAYDVIAYHIERKADSLICYIGFQSEIPIGWKGVVVPRSSITKTDWVLHNSPGTIDCPFRGEWQVRFKYVGERTPFEAPTPFKVGERVAQIYFEKVNEVELEFSDELTATPRGEGGFGSTNTQ